MDCLVPILIFFVLGGVVGFSVGLYFWNIDQKDWCRQKEELEQSQKKTVFFLDSPFENATIQFATFDSGLNWHTVKKTSVSVIVEGHIDPIKQGKLIEDLNERIAGDSGVVSEVSIFSD